MEKGGGSTTTRMVDHFTLGKLCNLQHILSISLLGFLITYQLTYYTVYTVSVIS